MTQVFPSNHLNEEEDKPITQACQEAFIKRLERVINSSKSCCKECPSNVPECPRIDDRTPSRGKGAPLENEQRSSLIDAFKRVFDTGASRDSDVGKLDFEGFIHPSVLIRYAEYMNENRVMRDGSVRDSDNWQNGIPCSAYMKSMFRHFVDVWSIHREGGDIEEQEKALCGVLFNAMGYLFEILTDGNGVGR